MNKNIKVGLIAVAILTIYSIGIYIFAAQKNSQNNNNEPEKIPENNNNENDKDIIKNENVFKADYNIILSPHTIIGYKNGIWQENPKLNYNNMLFDVYINNEYKDKKYLSYSDDWYIFNENKDFLDYEGNILAVNTSLEYRNIGFVTSEFNEIDQSEITKVLNDKGITSNYNELKKSKIIFDINKDGMRDNIYFISNSFEENSSSNKAFSIGFVKYYDKYEVFYEVIEDLDSIFTISNPSLQNILEIDNHTYLIVASEYYSNSGTEHHIYQVSDKNLLEVLKTKAN